MALDFRFSFAYTIYAMKKIDIFSRKYVDSLMQTCVHFYRRGIKGDQNTSTKRCKSLEGNKMTPIDLTTTATLANDEAKLVELILYIADKCENDPHFGKTKLNKILFFSDMLYYGFFGNAITGVEYFALENGPAPKRMIPVLEHLIGNGEACVAKRKIFGKEQHRVIPNRDANLDCFDAREIAFVDSVIEYFEGKNATDVSDLSHQYAGWKLASYKETIPYETIYVSTTPPTAMDMKRGLELVREYGW